MALPARHSTPSITVPSVLFLFPKPSGLSCSSNGENKMKKLILLVLSVMAALSINASQITHEQLVKINKFNKDWTNIVAMENKGVSMKIQQ
jgi:hypothetical protein